MLVGVVLLSGLHGYGQNPQNGAGDKNRPKATKKEQLEAERLELNRQIELTRLELQKVQSQRKSGLKQLQLLQTQIQQREKVIGAINREITQKENEIQEMEGVVLSLHSDLQRLKQRYAALLRQYHRKMHAHNSSLLVWSAPDLNQALRRSRHMRQYNAFRREQAQAIQELSSEMQQKEQELEVEKEAKVELKLQEQANRAALQKESQEQDKVVKELRKDEKKLRQALRNQEISRNKLQRSIEDLIRKEIEEARKAAEKNQKPGTQETDSKGSKGKSVPMKTEALLELTPEAKALGQAFEQNKGRLPWPLQKASLLESFGFHAHPFLKNVNIRNDGITLKAEPGAVVRAAFRGEVTAVVQIPGMQKTVIVRHGQYLTVYAHLAETEVSKGQKIQTGQSLGRLHVRAEDGQSTLQFQVWKGTTKVNPLPWLAGR